MVSDMDLSDEVNDQEEEEDVSIGDNGVAEFEEESLEEEDEGQEELGADDDLEEEDEDEDDQVCCQIRGRSCSLNIPSLAFT